MVVSRMYRWPAPKATLTGLVTEGTRYLNFNPLPSRSNMETFCEPKFTTATRLPFVSMAPALPLTPPLPCVETVWTNWPPVEYTSNWFWVAFDAVTTKAS